jgi:hypothetical protein
MNDERVTLVSLVEARGITSEAKHVRFEGRGVDGKPIEWPHDLWNVTIHYNGKSHSAEFRTGIGHRKLASGVKHDGWEYLLRVSTGDWVRNGLSAVEAHMLILPVVKGKVVPPSTADVLYCLASDASGAQGSFDEWCSNLGESNDSIKALETYRACQKTRDALLRMFGAELLDELAQAEH